MDDIVILFDVDGTLTPSGGIIKDEMINTLKLLKEFKNIELGIVGGGTYEKINKQMNNNLDLFRYVFCECGAVVYQYGELFEKNNMLEVVDRNNLNKIIKKALKIISKMDIMFNGHQIEFRNGLIYISPPGIQSTDFEREIFKKKDLEFNLRQNLIDELIKTDSNNQFDFVKGGETGITFYPKGWDKSQILPYFNTYNSIYFYGDRTEPGGNDYTLYSHPKVKGRTVENYLDTIKQLKNYFSLRDKIPDVDKYNNNNIIQENKKGYLNTLIKLIKLKI